MKSLKFGRVVLLLLIIASILLLCYYSFVLNSWPILGLSIVYGLFTFVFANRWITMVITPGKDVDTDEKNMATFKLSGFVVLILGSFFFLTSRNIDKCYAVTPKGYELVNCKYDSRPVYKHQSYG